MAIKTILMTAAYRRHRRAGVGGWHSAARQGMRRQDFTGSENGYSVLITSEPGSVDDGDTIVGDLNRVGFGSFYDSKSGRPFTASIDERGLSKSEVGVRIASELPVANRLQSHQRPSRACRRLRQQDLRQHPAGLRDPRAVVGRHCRQRRHADRRLQSRRPRHRSKTITGAEFVVFVDDFQLPKSAAARKVAESCH